MSRSASDHPAPEERPAPRAGAVSAIEPQKKNASRVSVYIDGDFAFGIEVDVLLEYPLSAGVVIDLETAEAIVLADARLRARRFSVAYLAHRARTVFEVREALRQRGFAPDVAEQAVERLCALGYLDDADYALRYVESRVRAKGYGPMRIRRELQRRGIQAALIDRAVAPLETSDSPAEQALRQARIRLPKLRGEADARKRRKKLSDFLLRRGFDFDTIQRAVDTALHEERDT
jgi:regulatory protein